MNRKICFFTIGIYDLEENLISNDISEFFNMVEDNLNDDPASTVKKIDIHTARIGPFYRRNGYSREEFVIPVAKLKESATFQVDKDNKTLKEIDEKVYDINCLYYNQNEKIAMITVAKTGPTPKLIQQYFQSFLKDCFIKINPIKYSTGLDVIEKAKYVKSVSIALDLTATDAKFYAERSINDSSVMDFIKKTAKKSHDDLSSNTFVLNFGMGKNRNEYMQKEALLDMLRQLDFNSNFIKEIIVCYKNDKEEKISPARLKDIFLDVYAIISADGAEYILEKSYELLSNKRNKFRNEADKMKGNYNVQIERYFVKKDCNHKSQLELLLV